MSATIHEVKSDAQSEKTLTAPKPLDNFVAFPFGFQKHDQPGQPLEKIRQNPCDKPGPTDVEAIAYGIASKAGSRAVDRLERLSGRQDSMALMISSKDT